MRKLFAILALSSLLAACGGNGDDPEPQAATPAPTETEAGPHDLEGYSEGVLKYYGDPHDHVEGGNVEAEYHQPPKPAEAAVGEMITLTGTNIGVRLEVTLKSVKRDGDRTQVRLHLRNNGIAVYEGPLQNAELTFAGGDTQPALTDETCSRDFDTSYLRMDVDDERTVCLLFEGADEPERLQLALEAVPTDAGGIWNLG